MQNVEYKVDPKAGTLTIVVNLKERHGLSNSGNTVTIAGTQGNQKIGHGDVAFGLNVYTKEGLADARLKAAKEAGHKTWEDMQAVAKGK